jgi:hypothetical protein
MTVEVATRLCYSKTAAINTFELDQSYQGDLGLILDWVYYYDVLSKFGIRHFSGRQRRMLVCAQKKHLTYVEMNSPDIDTVSDLREHYVIWLSYLQVWQDCSYARLFTFGDRWNILYDGPHAGTRDHWARGSRRY